MDSIKTIWQKYVTNVMKHKGLKQREFAELIGVNESQVSRWLKAQSMPKPQTVDKIVEKLQLPLSYAYETKQSYVIKENDTTYLNEPNDVKYQQPKNEKVGHKIIAYALEIISVANELNELAESFSFDDFSKVKQQDYDKELAKINSSINNIHFQLISKISLIIKEANNV